MWKIWNIDFIEHFILNTCKNIFNKIMFIRTHTNTESVQCISIVYSICPYKYNQWPFRPVEKSNSLISNVGRGKWNWQHSMAHPRKPSYRRKNLLRKLSYSPLCPKSRRHSNGGRSGKNAIGSIRWPIPENPPIGAKIWQNLLRKPCYSQFCPKFRCHGNGGWSGKMQLAAFDGPSPKTPKRCKHFAKISYASRVIANFVPNSVAMATGVGQEKCNWQHSMAHPRKPPYRRKNLAKSLTQAVL